jgi:phosphoglycolate phosphatase
MRELPEKLQAVIFDLDGTLVDTADEFVVVVQALRAEHGREPLPEQLIRSNVSNGARALTALALDLQESAPEFESKRLRLLELYSEVLGTVASLYPGIQELLDAFSERNIRWGIATNKPRAYTEPLLAALVTDRKPHPESLYLNCRHLDCSPANSVYIGDHQRDIEAGRRAGMVTIAATYGYIEDHDDPASWGANLQADCSHKLQALLLGDQ